MSEGLPLKTITIIRLITMSAGVLGALVMLFEYDVFSFAQAQRTTFSNVMIALVGIGCLFNLLRQIKVLRNLKNVSSKK